MDLNTNLREMARRCYGYGRWDAPYWFIGLGEGMTQDTDCQKRVDAWLHLGRRTGLSDCREFHYRIADERWHRKKPPAELQATWRRLLLLLMKFLGESADIDSLRKYQSEHWGMRKDVTCVIELFGLPAPNFKAHQALMLELFTQRQIDEILQERIDFIRKKIDESKHKPKLVVMYGRGARKQWREIAGRFLLDDEIYKIGSTMMVSAIHPTAHGVTDEYWEKLGKSLYAAARSR